MAGRVCPVKEIDVPAIKREALDSFVASVRNYEDRLRATLIDDETMRTAQLTRLFSGAAEGSNVLSLAVVLEEVTGTVPVADINIAILCDRYICRAVLERLPFRLRFCIRFRVFGITEGEDLLTG